MNKTFLIGNLTKDVDIRTTQSGKSVASFTIAVNRRFKDKEGEKQTDFFSIIAWGQLGDLCGKYLAKGRKVAVVGELQTRSYEKDGVKRYITEIIADEVEFLSPKETPQESAQEAQGGFVDVDDPESLPF